MGLFDPLQNQLKMVAQLSPKNLNRLARMQLTELVEREAVRAGGRVDELEGDVHPANIPRDGDKAQNRFESSGALSFFCSAMRAIARRMRLCCGPVTSPPLRALVTSCTVTGRPVRGFWPLAALAASSS